MESDKIKKVLISNKEIALAVSRLGSLITEEYKDENPLIICPLKGSLMFCADLMREIKIPCEIDFMKVSSYNSNTVSSGEVKIEKDLSCDIKGRRVIIAEDIIDTGNTLFEIYGLLKKRSPKEIKIFTLLDKPERRIKDIQADWSGFVIPDLFVVGYGMDLNERYRNLPYIGVYAD